MNKLIESAFPYCPSPELKGIEWLLEHEFYLLEWNQELSHYKLDRILCRTNGQDYCFTVTYHLRWKLTVVHNFETIFNEEGFEVEQLIESALETILK